jgi:TetR/AcrR family transcriptional regulator, lmrAB and yxaGH operons repressor
MAPRGTTRQRMIEATEALLRRQGYAATGWRTIVEEAGTPWGSAHHYFPGGKEQLGAEAVSLGGTHVAAVLRASLEAQPTVAGAVSAWFAAAAANLEASDFTDGCPVGTVALETAAHSPTLAIACERAMATWETLLTDALLGEGVNAERAQTLATHVVAALEGALMLARVRRDTTPVRLTAEVLEDLLARA